MEELPEIDGDENDGSPSPLGGGMERKGSTFSQHLEPLRFRGRSESFRSSVSETDSDTSSIHSVKRTSNTPVIRVPLKDGPDQMQRRSPIPNRVTLSRASSISSNYSDRGSISGINAVGRTSLGLVPVARRPSYLSPNAANGNIPGSPGGGYPGARRMTRSSLRTSIGGESILTYKLPKSDSDQHRDSHVGSIFDHMQAGRLSQFHPAGDDIGSNNGSSFKDPFFGSDNNANGYGVAGGSDTNRFRKHGESFQSGFAAGPMMSWNQENLANNQKNYNQFRNDARKAFQRNQMRASANQVTEWRKNSRNLSINRVDRTIFLQLTLLYLLFAIIIIMVGILLELGIFDFSGTEAGWALFFGIAFSPKAIGVALLVIIWFSWQMTRFICSINLQSCHLYCVRFSAFPVFWIMLCAEEWRQLIFIVWMSWAIFIQNAKRPNNQFSNHGKSGPADRDVVTPFSETRHSSFSADSPKRRGTQLTSLYPLGQGYFAQSKISIFKSAWFTFLIFYLTYLAATAISYASMPQNVLSISQWSTSAGLLQSSQSNLFPSASSSSASEDAFDQSTMPPVWLCKDLLSTDGIVSILQQISKDSALNATSESFARAADGLLQCRFLCSSARDPVACGGFGTLFQPDAQESLATLISKTNYMRHVIEEIIILAASSCICLVLSAGSKFGIQTWQLELYKKQHQQQQSMLTREKSIRPAVSYMSLNKRKSSVQPFPSSNTSNNNNNNNSNIGTSISVTNGEGGFGLSHRESFFSRARKSILSNFSSFAGSRNRLNGDLDKDGITEEDVEEEDEENGNDDDENGSAEQDVNNASGGVANGGGGGSGGGGNFGASKKNKTKGSKKKNSVGADGNDAGGGNGGNGAEADQENGEQGVPLGRYTWYEFDSPFSRVVSILHQIMDESEENGDYETIAALDVVIQELSSQKDLFAPAVDLDPNVDEETAEWLRVFLLDQQRPSVIPSNTQRLSAVSNVSQTGSSFTNPSGNGRRESQYNRLSVSNNGNNSNGISNSLNGSLFEDLDNLGGGNQVPDESALLRRSSYVRLRSKPRTSRIQSIKSITELESSSNSNREQQVGGASDLHRDSTVIEIPDKQIDQNTSSERLVVAEALSSAPKNVAADSAEAGASPVSSQLQSSASSTSVSASRGANIPSSAANNNTIGDGSVAAIAPANNNTTGTKENISTNNNNTATGSQSLLDNRRFVGDSEDLAASLTSATATPSTSAVAAGAGAGAGAASTAAPGNSLRPKKIDIQNSLAESILRRSIGNLLNNNNNNNASQQLGGSRNASTNKINTIVNNAGSSLTEASGNAPQAGTSASENQSTGSSNRQGASLFADSNRRKQSLALTKQAHDPVHFSQPLLNEDRVESSSLRRMSTTTDIEELVRNDKPTAPSAAVRPVIAEPANNRKFSITVTNVDEEEMSKKSGHDATYINASSNIRNKPMISNQTSMSRSSSSFLTENTTTQSEALLYSSNRQETAAVASAHPSSVVYTKPSSTTTSPAAQTGSVNYTSGARRSLTNSSTTPMVVLQSSSMDTISDRTGNNRNEDRMLKSVMQKKANKHEILLIQSHSAGGGSADDEGNGNEENHRAQGHQDGHQWIMRRDNFTLNEEALHEALYEVDSWNWDVFRLAEVTNGRPLYYLAYLLFEKHDLINSLNLDPEAVKGLFAKIESGYQLVPYHNSVHAADVLHAMNFFITHKRFLPIFDLKDILCSLLAASIHDYDHPGFTNQFIIGTRHRLSLLYNDRSVLENHHLSFFFRTIANDDSLNIFKMFGPVVYGQMRARIISIVLATDVSCHFEFMTKFRNKVLGSTLNLSTEEDKGLVLQVCMKCSDTSNCARIPTRSQEWTRRITEEFYRQGDEERKRGMPISAFMDRSNPNVPKCQMNFIDFIVAPLIDAYVLFFPDDRDIAKIRRNVGVNRKYWQAVHDGVPFVESPVPSELDSEDSDDEHQHDDNQLHQQHQQQQQHQHQQQPQRQQYNQHSGHANHPDGHGHGAVAINVVPTTSNGMSTTTAGGSAGNEGPVSHHESISNAGDGTHVNNVISIGHGSTAAAAAAAAGTGLTALVNLNSPLTPISNSSTQTPTAAAAATFTAVNTAAGSGAAPEAAGSVTSNGMSTTNAIHTAAAAGTTTTGGNNAGSVSMASNLIHILNSRSNFLQRTSSAGDVVDTHQLKMSSGLTSVSPSPILKPVVAIQTNFGSQLGPGLASGGPHSAILPTGNGGIGISSTVGSTTAGLGGGGPIMIGSPVSVQGKHRRNVSQPRNINTNRISERKVAPIEDDDVGPLKGEPTYGSQAFASSDNSNNNNISTPRQYTPSSSNSPTGPTQVQGVLLSHANPTSSSPAEGDQASSTGNPQTAAAGTGITGTVTSMMRRGSRILQAWKHG